MTDGDVPGAPGAAARPSNDIAALADAIDARARQAASESAATLLRGTLGSVTEVLTAIQDRLDAVDVAFNLRLDQLEATFVEVVDAGQSARRTPVDEVRRTTADDVAARLDSLEHRLTARVEGLAVGVEAGRRLLEQLLRDAENSLGRKASERTRRLAADFGIRTKGRPGSGDRGDPPELGRA